MWLFSKERTAFPYQVDPLSDEIVGDWLLRQCKNTKTGAACSSWFLDCTRGSTVDTELLMRGKDLIKRMKTLRHPNFITYVDSLESVDSVTLVTEPATPLHVYLRRSGDSGNLTYLTSWGLYQISKALDFFNKDIKLQHNNVRMTSVFVTPAGDWKLCGLEYVQPMSDPLPETSPPSTDVYWPPDKKRIDSWGLGCLMWEVYNSGGLRDANQLRVFGNIPQALIPQYSELVHLKSMRRCTITDFLSRATSSTGFFDNFYVKSLLFLEEIQIKDKEEKLTFLSGLADNVNTFPDDVAKFKILPHLMHFLQYGGAGAEVLTPLLRLGKLLDTTEFEQKVLPCLVKLFSSPDRATRVRLLEQLPSFIEHLPEKCVNEQIYPPVAQGFIDSNPVVREATIRAMVPLSQKLSSRILNDGLPRSLTLLQVKDEQGGIRANATICLVKIAGRMSAKTRQGPLLNTFLKCTRDPYPPARRMAVTALATTLPFYTLKDTACKVMPCLSFLTVDPVREVRDETFKSMAVAITRLERASEDAMVAEKEDQQANSGGGVETAGMAASAASAGSAALAWTNWAVSALSAKFAKSNTAPTGPGPAPVAAEKISIVSIEEPKSYDSDFVADGSQKKPASSYHWDNKPKGGGGEGWDDAEFHDAHEEVEDEEDGSWVSLDAIGNKTAARATDDWNSNDFFEQAVSTSASRPHRESKVASASTSSSSTSGSGLGGRKAMKLGKKLGGTSDRPSALSARHGMDRDGDWGSSCSTGDTKKAVASRENSDRSSPANDWGSSSSTADAKKTAASRGKSDRASPANDWDSSWGMEEKGSMPSQQKQEGWFADGDWGSEPKRPSSQRSNDDWGSSWGNSASTSQQKPRSSPSADDWNSWGNTASTSHKKQRSSPPVGDWGSSWSSGGKRDASKSAKTKGSDDGWDAW